ncbi:MAG: nickel-responsive transcriptional regulator NikR [Firmicutes bacterium]|nr:nickel-responsive transcriptional regulator NikR [Bacillota bacterium]
MAEELVRFGVSMNAQLLAKFDRLIRRKGYANRSEAIRDMVRGLLVDEEWQTGSSEVVGTATLVYDHHVNNLATTLNEIQHDHHSVIISTLHVHLDHHNCLEVLVLKGKADEIKQVGERLISVKGVKHGKLVFTSTGKELT